MNILFVTGHPAQIHHFKHVKSQLELKGHKVFWAASSKEISFDLLRHEKIEFIEIQKAGKGFLGKIRSLFVNNRKLGNFIRKNNIQVVVSRVSPFVSLATFWYRVFHIGISDTEKSGIYDTVFTKSVNVFISSDTFQRNLRKDQIRIKSNTELFYLHKNHFIPNFSKLSALNIGLDKPYTVVRFVSWNAYHDKGQNGIKHEYRLELIKRLEKHSSVYISSEGELPTELKPYELNIPPYLMHDLLNFAALYIGEGASMAAEAALMGTPSILVNDIQSGNGEDLLNHGILHVFSSNEVAQRKAIDTAEEILKNRESKQEMKNSLEAYLKNKIDGTAFLVWLIENGSKAKSIMLRNPEFQNRFK
jgi:predicted glycosyltransferase